MSIMGKRVLRIEDPKFLTTGAVYTADLEDEKLNNAAFAYFVRSTMAHARILSVDVSEAAASPGVLAVYTAADVGDLPPAPPLLPMFPPPMMARPYLAGEKALFVGEPVAVVVAETASQAADAGELVIVDYDPLEAIVDPEKSVEDSTIIHEEAGTNVAADFVMMGMMSGINEEEDIFKDCEVVLSENVVNHRVAPAPLEGRSAACAWEGEKLTYWSSNQAPHNFLGVLQAVYGPPAPAEGEEPPPTDFHVRSIAPDVGGGFGQKIRPTPEELILPWLSQKLDRPIRWTETRSENLLAAGHGRGQIQKITIGGSKDGEVQAYRIEILCDAGAYADLGCFLPYFTNIMASGVYKIPKIETAAKSVITNKVLAVSYRGAGRPEATAAIERAMDIFAVEIDMDPAELRRKNMIQADEFPHTTANGTEYDTGDYQKALDLALEAAGYGDLRKEQEARRKNNDTSLLGIGICSYVEVTAGPAPGGVEFAKVEITPEGKAKVYSGSFSHGHSHQTTFAMLASEQLGMPLEDIEVIQGDTDLVAQGAGTMGSRSLQLGGSAVHEAAGEVAQAAKEAAANLLEAAADDIVIDGEKGHFHVAGTPAVSVSWEEIAKAGTDSLNSENEYTGGASYPFGVHVAVVEVDSETGGVKLSRLITCDDSGVILNPLIVEGQRHGGNAQGAAQALLEEIRYDADGNLATSNFLDYGIISATELPSFELESTEVPTPVNVLGVKGIGESGAIGSTPAVQSAVVDALSHLGVRHVDIPCTAEKVWRAIADAS